MEYTFDNLDARDTNGNNKLVELAFPKYETAFIYQYGCNRRLV
jgi:hypothetical protein